MFITSKRGAKDNIVTYEHICDTTEDLQKIDPQYITLGSTCIVVQGENGGVDAYIATSDKQWVPLGGGSGSGSSEEDTKKYEDSDVRFIDYDGKVVDGYTAEEFLQLNKMPKNPNHKNDKISLTAQGWNWSLADAQAYVRKYGKLNVGQMYIPTDGKTHMILDVGVRKTIPLMIQQTVSEGVTINWGDGSEEETIEGTGVVTTSHTYEAEGEYEITLDAVDGCTLDFGGTVNETACNVFGESATRMYISQLKKLFIGNNVLGIGEKAFSGCVTLCNLTMPNSVVSIKLYAYANCANLISLVIPDSVTYIERQAFGFCFNLTNLTIPDSITSIGSQAFYGCYILTNLTIPDSITSIGSYTFGSCFNLTNLTIPDSVTSIGQQAFNGCYMLTNLTIPGTVTSIGIQAFNSCIALTNLVIPDGVTSIAQQAFSSCFNLTDLIIPNSVISIGQQAFYGCYILTNLTIPNNVTSIGTQAFSNCYTLYSLTILSEIPPTLSNVNAFNNMPSDCTIYVPHGKGDTYKADSKWSTWASQIQELPE